MVFVLFFLWAHIKVFAVEVSKMERISINGQEVNFDPPGDEVNAGDFAYGRDGAICKSNGQWRGSSFR